MAAALEKPADPKPKSRVNSADPDRRLTTCSTGSAYSLSGNAPYAAMTTPSFTSSVGLVVYHLQTALNGCLTPNVARQGDARALGMGLRTRAARATPE